MATQEKVTGVQLLFVQNILPLRAFVVALMPDFSQVDDVIQETFLTVSDKADEFTEGSNFTAWVCTIARFKVFEVARRSKRKVELLDEDVVQALCETDVEFGYSQEELTAIETCKQTLAPQALRAIELRYDQACRPPEIAELMGWTIAAVNVALSRARKTLRECVARRLAGAELRGGA